MQEPVSSRQGSFTKSALVSQLFRKIKNIVRHWAFDLIAPKGYWEARSILNILINKYGWTYSRQIQQAIIGDGIPTPWYSYPTVEYIDQLDFSEKDVFEWGAGNSSLYWASVARSVKSIENDPDWYERIRVQASNNLTIEYAHGPDFVKAIENDKRSYDVIIIDGSHRVECARVASKYLRDGGMIILDNSDWYPEAAAILQESGLLQVDMSGFAAICQFTISTSLFFHRDFSLKAKGQAQPRPSLGAIPKPELVV